MASPFPHRDESIVALGNVIVPNLTRDEWSSFPFPSEITRDTAKRLLVGDHGQDETFHRLIVSNTKSRAIIGFDLGTSRPSSWMMYRRMHATNSSAWMVPPMHEPPANVDISSFPEWNTRSPGCPIPIKFTPVAIEPCIDRYGIHDNISWKPFAPGKRSIAREYYSTRYVGSNRSGKGMTRLNSSYVSWYSDRDAQLPRLHDALFGNAW